MTSSNLNTTEIKFRIYTEQDSQALPSDSDIHTHKAELQESHELFQFISPISKKSGLYSALCAVISM